MWIEHENGSVRACWRASTSYRLTFTPWMGHFWNLQSISSSPSIQPERHAWTSSRSPTLSRLVFIPISVKLNNHWLVREKNEYHISSSRLSSHDGIQTKETRIFFHQSNNRLEWRTCNCSCREDPSGPLIEYFYHPKAQKSSYESRMSKRNGSKNHTPR